MHPCSLILWFKRSGEYRWTAIGHKVLEMTGTKVPIIRPQLLVITLHYLFRLQPTDIASSFTTWMLGFKLSQIPELYHPIIQHSSSAIGINARFIQFVSLKQRALDWWPRIQSVPCTYPILALHQTCNFSHDALSRLDQMVLLGSCPSGCPSGWLW